MFDDARQSIVIEAFAKRMIKLNIQAVIDSVDFILAVRQELFPQRQVLRVTFMQLGRFLKNRDIHVGVFRGQFGQFSVTINRIDLSLQRLDIRLDRGNSPSCGFRIFPELLLVLWLETFVRFRLIRRLFCRLSIAFRSGELVRHRRQ
mgnify:CR=1 FL=1